MKHLMNYHSSTLVANASKMKVSLENYELLPVTLGVAANICDFIRMEDIQDKPASSSSNF